jgi:hypothetical protein
METVDLVSWMRESKTKKVRMYTTLGNRMLGRALQGTPTRYCSQAKKEVPS